MRCLRRENDSLLEFPQSLFLLNQFSDVHARTNVARKPSLRVITRHTLIGNPAMLSIVSSQPVLHHEWLSRIERAGVNLQALLQVVSMHAFTPAISKILFHTAAGKIQPWLVKESAELVGAGHPDQNRRGIRHDTKPRLAFVQLRLSSYALLDHCRQKQQGNRKNDEKYLN